MSIESTDMAFLAQMVRNRSGIELDEDKNYLIESRLSQLALRRHIDSVNSLIKELRQSPHGDLAAEVIDSMTTNETMFFRDDEPFKVFRSRVLPEIIEKQRAEKSLKIWCAASSTGQEPYSIAMIIREYFPELLDWNLEIRATDISVAALERAREGKYSLMEIGRGMPQDLQLRYFTEVGHEFQLRQDIRKMVSYSELNLCDYWPAMPQFDIVFCRNVLIYFSIDSKRTIFSKIRRVLKPHGFLFLGCGETTINLDDSFERLDASRSGCYVQAKKGKQP